MTTRPTTADQFNTSDLIVVYSNLNADYQIVPFNVFNTLISDTVDAAVQSTNNQAAETVAGVDLQALATSIENLENTIAQAEAANFATDISALQVSIGGINSSIMNLSEADIGLTQTLETHTTQIDGHTSQISNILQTSQGQATSLSTLTSTVGSHTSQLTTQATTIATLDAGAQAGIVFRAAAGGATGSLELAAFSDVNGSASTLRIDADNILINGTIQTAHIGDLQVDTVKLQDNAVTLPEDAYEGANQSVTYNANSTSLNSTPIITKSITPSNGNISIFLDVEFGVQNLGTVTGGSADVFRGAAYVDIYRKVGTGAFSLISTKKFGQYIRDNDPDADERYDLTELSNMGLYFDRDVGTDEITYEARARVNIINGADAISGFVPRVEEVTMLILELKK